MTVISDDKKPAKKNQVTVNDGDSNDSSSPVNDNSYEGQNYDGNENAETELSDELVFPTQTMKQVIDMVNKTRWVVPVLPEGDLEVLLLVSIRYAYAKKDEEIVEFKDVYKSAFKVSFDKIMNDDAILNWKMDILDSIYRNSIIFLKLCAMKISDDIYVLLEILGMVFNPDGKYHTCNTNYSSSVLTRVDRLTDFLLLLNKCKNSENNNQSDSEVQLLPPEDERKYAFLSDQKRSRFIFVDLINCFGHFDGFENIKNRIEKIEKIEEPDLWENLNILIFLLKPISQIMDFLTNFTKTEYIIPIAEKSVSLILNLNENFIKPENIKEWKSDKFSNLIENLEKILRKCEMNEEYIIKLCVFRLNFILKVLQHASFNGRMNALNELNKLINSSTRQEFIVSWIKNNEILSIVLKENLHQLQYVEKVEKLIRFMVQSKCMTNDDLDRLWDSQIGKHEAIVTNIHDLLAKLAYNFSPTQLQHLFECFQNSWINASKRQRERLIDLIRRLAEEDKDGRMAATALNLLWDLATQDDSPIDIMESALKAHVKILDFCSNSDRDRYRNEWLKNLINHLQNQNNHKNTLSTLRQIKEIIKLFQNNTFQTISPTKCQIIRDLEDNYFILKLITKNLVDYLKQFREQPETEFNENNQTVFDDKFPHDVQIDERLEILRFLLSEGQQNLELDLLKEIWNSLVLQHSVDVHSIDNEKSQLIVWERDQCFKWFATLAEYNNSYFNHDDLEYFFENLFLKLDPKCLTLNGIMLFEQIFRIVNSRRGYLDSENYQVKNRGLIGLEYLWRCAMMCTDEDVFNKILHLLRSIFTYLDPTISRNEVNSDFIQHCMQILQSAYDTEHFLLQEIKPVNPNDERCVENYFEITKDMEESVHKLANIIQILCEFIRECDLRYTKERLYPALCRITYGYRYNINVQYTSTFSRNNTQKHFDLPVHSNELFINLRERIEENLPDTKRKDFTFEITRNNEIIDTIDNYKTLEQLNITEGTLLGVRFVSMFPQRTFTEKEEDETNLPGVQICNNEKFMDLIIRIGDLALTINNEKLRWSVNLLLNLLPPNRRYQDQLLAAIISPDLSNLESLLHNRTPMITMYLINILYSLLLSCDNSVKSIDHLYHLLKNNALQVFLKMIHFDNKNSMDVFVLKSCESSPIRLIALTHLMNIIYLLLTMLYKTLFLQKSTLIESPRYSRFIENTPQTIIPIDITNEKFISLAQHDHINKSIFKYVKHCLPTKTDVESFMKLAWCCSLGNRIEMMMNDLRNFSKESSINYSSNQYSNIQLNTNSFPLFQASSSSFNISGITSNNNLSLNTGGTTSQPPSRYDSSTTPDTQSNIVFYGGAVSNSVQQFDTANLTLASSPAESMINKPTICALECFSLVLALCRETTILDLIKEKYTKDFILVLLLSSKTPFIREKGANEIRFILQYSSNSKAVEHVIQMLFLKLHNVNDNPVQYNIVYNLVVQLLSDLHDMKTQMTNTEPLLKTQLEKLLETKSLPNNMSLQIRANYETLLTGRLKIIKELFRFLSPAEKTAYNRNHSFVNIILDTFLFPSSKRYSEIRSYQQENQCNTHTYIPSTDYNREFPKWATAPIFNPICNTSESQKCAFELLKVLVAGSPENMRNLLERLNGFFYSDNRLINNEWDYKPSFTSRSVTGYVGLKNAGATCYMNSIIQQLFMIAPLRNFLLMVDAGPPNTINDYDDSNMYFTRRDLTRKQTDPKTARIDILREIQMIFGNLAFSQNQFFTPQGFWKHFKFWGDEVNLREQHDALEFFTCLVDTLDEGLHSISKPKIFEEVLQGQFADQKICKGCPHRYECEEKFFQLSVDIRNHENLIESLEQYVKGDLLEGDNAYFCESCKTKRDTIKRTCIKKLPLVLAIQLKRFDYDWERDVAVKFNDYFEFPNELDMEPYTVNGIMRRDHLNSINELVRSSSGLSSDDTSEENTSSITTDNLKNNTSTPTSSTKYTLKGVVVHGGQATGGHYYSYIRDKKKFDSNLTPNPTGGNSVVNPTQSQSNLMTNSTTGLTASASATGIGTGGVNGLGVNTSTIPQSATTGNIQHHPSDPNLAANLDDNSTYSWYRFDDTEVTEVRMDPEEMKNQWFGGEFVGESYDHLIKRVSMRRQKRWWSAYILFYERDDFAKHHTLNELKKQLLEVDVHEKCTNNNGTSSELTGSSLVNDIDTLSDSVKRIDIPQDCDTTLTLHNLTITDDSKTPINDEPSSKNFLDNQNDSDNNNTFNITKLPRHIEDTITLQNIEYMHNKSQYTVEYFSFIRELPLLVSPSSYYLPVKSDKLELKLMSKEELDKTKAYVTEVVTKFLFSIGFRTSKIIRGPALKWFDSLKHILCDCEKARLKFCAHAIFNPINKVTEYLLESPIPEIREVYCQFIRCISSWSLRDTTHCGYLLTDFQREHLKDIYTFIKDRYKTDQRLRLAHILLSIVHVLLNKEMNDYGAAANEYLNIFLEYPMMGYPELSHSLDINLATHILKFTLDDYYSNSGASRLDISPILCSFCRLMRCYDVNNITHEIQIEMLIPSATQLAVIYPNNPPNQVSIAAQNPIAKNPYCYIMDNIEISCMRKIPDHLCRYLYNKTDKYIKKVVDEFYNEDTKDDFNVFIKFLCYNNIDCSQKILDFFSKEIVNAFIRNIKLFMEIFRTTVDIDDDYKVKRAIILLEGGHLDFASKFKTSSEKRCYFIMKIVNLGLSKLNIEEQKILWEKIRDPKSIFDKFDRAMKAIRKALSISDSRKLNDYKSSYTTESNEESSNSCIIERTNSSDNIEKIGKEFLSLYDSQDDGARADFAEQIEEEEDESGDFDNCQTYIKTSTYPNDFYVRQGIDENISNQDLEEQRMKQPIPVTSPSSSNSSSSVVIPITPSSSSSSSCPTTTNITAPTTTVPIVSTCPPSYQLQNIPHKSSSHQNVPSEGSNSTTAASYCDDSREEEDDDDEEDDDEENVDDQDDNGADDGDEDDDSKNNENLAPINKAPSKL